MFLVTKIHDPFVAVKNVKIKNRSVFMKKFLSKMLVFALVVCLSGVVSVFAGCTNNKTSSIDYEHTIVFYSSQGDKLKTLTENAIKSFEAKYPGWTVEHSTQGGYDDVKDKIVADLQAGTQPDLAYCYPDHVALYLQTGKVVDLNKYINSTEYAHWNETDSEGNTTVHNTNQLVGYTAAEQADFVEAYYNEGLATNFGGYAKYGYSSDAMLVLPFVKSTELLYYNKTALDGANLTPATTWDELWAQCETLMARYPKCTPLGYDSEANWFITMCEQNGWGYTSADDDNHYLFNGQDQAAWLAQLAEYYQKGYFTTQTEYDAYTSGLFTKGVEKEAGGIVYCVGSSGGASYQDPGDVFTVGVTSIPGSKQADGTVNNAVISQGPSLVMLTGGNKVSNASEKEMMTFMFIKELLDVTFQTSFSIESGYNAVRYSVSDVDEWKEHVAADNITAKAASVGEQMRDSYFTSPAFIGSSTARTQVENVLLYSIRGTKTPTEALADAYKNCGGK